jgi:putative oxidoreductase
MVEMVKQLLYSDAGSELNNWTLFFFRILLAFELFRVHGLRKLKNEMGQEEQIPNPLYLPEKLNQFVANFSDLVAPFFVMVGFATRLVVLPIIGVTAIGYAVVHRRDSLQVRDVPYVYTLSFLLLLLMGPGKYSIDQSLLYSLF